MLERPPRDDLRVQRIVFRVLRSGLILVGIGAVAISVTSLFLHQPLPTSARAWAGAIAGWAVLQIVYSVYDRVFGRVFNTDEDGWEERYRERRDAAIDEFSERRPRRFRRLGPSQLPPRA